MSVKVTLEFDNAGEAIAALSKLNGEVAPTKPGKPAPAPSTVSAPTSPTAPATAPAQPTKDSSSASKARIYTDTPLAGLINDVVKAGKMDAAKKLLAEFGVKKGPELQPAQFDEAEAKFKALLTENGEALG